MTAVEKSERSEKSRAKEASSYKIFMSFVKMKDGIVDASGILSEACYKEWIESRRKHPLKPQEAYRRALTAHCRGVDGRRPFPETVEKSLLIELRKKQRWKCFDNCTHSYGQIGIQGFPSLGHHEKLNKSKKREAPQQNKSDEIYCSNKLQKLSNHPSVVEARPYLQYLEEYEVDLDPPIIPEYKATFPYSMQKQEKNDATIVDASTKLAVPEYSFFAKEEIFNFVDTTSTLRKKCSFGYKQSDEEYSGDLFGELLQLIDV